jgi:hypothetical protein
MPDNVDDPQSVDGDMREAEWLRLVRLRSKTQGNVVTVRSRSWARALASTGIFFTFFGLWWLRYIWSVAGLYSIFSIGGLLLVFGSTGFGVLLLAKAARKSG